MAVADELALLLVEKPEGERSQAREQRQRFHLLKERFRLVALLQVVIGNARAQMVNVMKANVAREPLEHFRQFVERAAMQRRGRIVPVPAAFPIDILELMLHIKQPYSGGS